MRAPSDFESFFKYFDKMFFHHLPKEINSITNPSAIDKIKSSRYNTPLTRGLLRTGAYLYNPTFLGTELRDLIQAKELYDETKEQTMRMSNRHVDHFKIDYSLDATDNPVKLAYADLKTNSQLSNVKDVS